MIKPEYFFSFSEKKKKAYLYDPEYFNRVNKECEKLNIMYGFKRTMTHDIEIEYNEGEKKLEVFWTFKDYKNTAISILNDMEQIIEHHNLDKENFKFKIDIT